jgi:hypothetical protein
MASLKPRGIRFKATPTLCPITDILVDMIQQKGPSCRIFGSTREKPKNFLKQNPGAIVG